MKKKKTKEKTVLEWIPFKEVWNNCCYLENGDILGAIKVNCMNLHLMYEDEQTIKIDQFRKVLLGMDYPIKILSIDKPIDLKNNLEALNTILKTEANIAKSNLLKEALDHF